MPVNCGGVVVNPGDIIFGDDDGIIVASEEQIAVRSSYSTAHPPHAMCASYLNCILDTLLLIVCPWIQAILPAAEAVIAAEDELLKGMQSGISLLDQLNFKVQP